MTSFTPLLIGSGSGYLAFRREMMTHDVWTTWEVGACVYWPVSQDWRYSDIRGEKIID